MLNLRKHFHTANMIRQAVGACPDGICMAEADGSPILANKIINELSFSLTGHTVLNAASFWAELKQLALLQPDAGEPAGDGGEYLLLRLQDGGVWQFRRRTLPVRGRTVWQYEASDVTQLFAYRERLRENNLRTEQFHARQRELIRGIVRNNEEKERLHAKMQIHDHMGRVLLMTKLALENDGEQADDALFSAWEDVVKDLETAAQKQSSGPLPEQELKEVAAMIGCRVTFSGRQPAERKALLLLYAAIREALTNAVRHAGADELFVDIRDGISSYAVTIRDNGGLAVQEPLREGDGLSTLRRRLEEEGASMRLETAEGVVMHLEIPKE